MSMALLPHIHAYGLVAVFAIGISAWLLHRYALLAPKARDGHPWRTSGDSCCLVCLSAPSPLGPCGFWGTEKRYDCCVRVAGVVVVVHGIPKVVTQLLHYGSFRSSTPAPPVPQGIWCDGLGHLPGQGRPALREVPMHKRVLLILLIWFLAVMITVPILVIFDVIGADQGRDPLRTILGLAFLLLAAGAVFLGLSGARPTLAMLVLFRLG